MTRYAALPGYYKFMFLYLEPLSLIGPIIGGALWGPQWFYNELVPPTGPPPTDLDPRAQIAIWQLSISYALLFILTSLVLRTTRNLLHHNLAAQEKLTGTFLGCLVFGDYVHSVLTFLTLPDDIKYKPLQWNTTTHGNTSFVLLLHVSRICWFLGVGRKRYYFGQPKSVRDSAYPVAKAE